MRLAYKVPQGRGTSQSTRAMNQPSHEATGYALRNCVASNQEPQELEKQALSLFGIPRLRGSKDKTA
jgi:hypothetical protein